MAAGNGADGDVVDALIQPAQGRGGDLDERPVAAARGQRELVAQQAGESQRIQLRIQPRVGEHRAQPVEGEQSLVDVERDGSR